MRISNLKNPALLLPLVAIFLMFKYMNIPATISEFNGELALFLCFIALLERILIKFYTPLWFSFFIVVLGLLIFDENSIFYSLFYFATGLIFNTIKNKGKNITNLLPATSIGIIGIIIGNEYYGHFAYQTFFYRYMTFIFLLILSLFLTKLYSYLEYRKSSSFFISMFLPILFKVLVIFPVLSLYHYFNFFIITLMLTIYLSFLNFCRGKLLSISDHHVQNLIDSIKQKHQLDIFFMELGSIKGVYYPKKKIIAIDEKLDYPEQLQTIIHEYLHHLLNKKLKYKFLIEEFFVMILEGIVSWIFILQVKKGANL
ncbi:ImmA/IrrE family metallo-endopeptidase [Neobacillus sp. D3-1R]|uniref:ImmA/IrrE family metallo-endopeptidase n=1 Tax=Neobacillus sp. D3-1R TaxID=3445778 RepID=UPI003FA06F67